MKRYKVTLERTSFTTLIIEAKNDEAAQDKAWEAAVLLEKLQPITDNLGEVEVHTVEELK